MQLTLDHVVPISRGGETTWENVVTACKKCNNKKGNQMLYETRLKLARPTQNTFNLNIFAAQPSFSRVPPVVGENICISTKSCKIPKN